MPTHEDRASASIRFEGEARRLTIRRPRLDRDGFFLFGRRYSAQTVTLTAGETDQLRGGRTIAVDVVGEYVVYLHSQGDQGTQRATQSAPAPGCSSCTGGGIPQRQFPDQAPSDLVRAVAARVRVNADRRAGVRNTPQWIIDLANSEQISYWPGDARTTEPLRSARGLQRLWRTWRAIAARLHVRRTYGGH